MNARHVGIFFSLLALVVVVVHFSLKMSKYSVPERISIVKAYYSSNSSPLAAQRKFTTESKLKTTGASVITIKNVIEKFEKMVVSMSRHFSDFCRILLFACATS
ncbi:hypothetical protein AVEN_259239-1 [Araneus ventricosus]|uniref:DUF4817 domain-containing protein n=1 Tax=Araneus ventricosus TaxID=182803 RepID=A0A4Y2I554_ARAVE|nr:hypothetical protein AVEN_259239-1 [Araneus ventricosus]